MHKVHSGDLHYSVVMLTDVVAKAGGYSLIDMHVMKNQAILWLGLCCCQYCKKSRVSDAIYISEHPAIADI